jgi:hypothetical protein
MICVSEAPNLFSSASASMRNARAFTSANSAAT